MAVKAFIQLLNIHIFCHVSARYRNLLQLVSRDLDQFVKIKENRTQLKTGLSYRIASTTNGNPLWGQIWRGPLFFPWFSGARDLRGFEGEMTWHCWAHICPFIGHLLTTGWAHSQFEKIVLGFDVSLLATFVAFPCVRGAHHPPPSRQLGPTPSSPLSAPRHVTLPLERELRFVDWTINKFY